MYFYYNQQKNNYNDTREAAQEAIRKYKTDLKEYYANQNAEREENLISKAAEDLFNKEKQQIEIEKAAKYEKDQAFKEECYRREYALIHGVQIKDESYCNSLMNGSQLIINKYATAIPFG